MTAETIAKALGGRKIGTDWMVRCPAHHDRKPSLSIRDADDGKVLICCHARCGQEPVIVVLRARGLWPKKLIRRHAVPTVLKNRTDKDGSGRIEVALAIRGLTKPVPGIPVETYLASRGIDLPPPGALRFHSGLRHPSGDAWPAMVALVTPGHDGAALAMHCAFLARDGNGKAPVEPAKMMLGPCGGGVALVVVSPRQALMKR
jgi:putative DNA primase/helicase